MEFKRVEDAAVDAAIRLQDNAGLAMVTDGEMRRLSFQSKIQRRKARTIGTSAFFALTANASRAPPVVTVQLLIENLWLSNLPIVR